MVKYDKCNDESLTNCGNTSSSRQCHVNKSGTKCVSRGSKTPKVTGACSDFDGKHFGNRDQCNAGTDLKSGRGCEWKAHKSGKHRLGKCVAVPKQGDGTCKSLSANACKSDNSCSWSKGKKRKGKKGRGKGSCKSKKDKTETAQRAIYFPTDGGKHDIDGCSLASAGFLNTRDKMAACLQHGTEVTPARSGLTQEQADELNQLGGTCNWSNNACSERPEVAQLLRDFEYQNKNLGHATDPEFVAARQKLATEFAEEKQQKDNAKSRKEAMERLNAIIGFANAVSNKSGKISSEQMRKYYKLVPADVLQEIASAETPEERVQHVQRHISSHAQGNAPSTLTPGAPVPGSGSLGATVPMTPGDVPQSPSLGRYVAPSFAQNVAEDVDQGLSGLSNGFNSGRRYGANSRRRSGRKSRGRRSGARKSRGRKSRGRRSGARRSGRKARKSRKGRGRKSRKSAPKGRKSRKSAKSCKSKCAGVTKKVCNGQSKAMKNCAWRKNTGCVKKPRRSGRKSRARRSGRKSRARRSGRKSRARRSGRKSRARRSGRKSRGRKSRRSGRKSRGRKSRRSGRKSRFDDEEQEQEQE